MRKLSVLVISAACFAFFAPPLTAEEQEEPRRPKIGVFLGYPVAAGILGFPLGRFMEVNLLVGYDYRDLYPFILRYSSSASSAPLSPEISILSIPLPVMGGGFYTGANLLFTLFKINVGGEIFPLSLGPQAAFSIWLDGNVRVDVTAVLRLEYTFSTHLNAFIEGGTGAGFNIAGSNLTKMNSPFPVSFAGLGIRYIF